MRKTKTSLIIFHIITMFQGISNNLAHPVTPAFINNLELRDSMFGTAFASMALGIFLFSLFWGELSSRIKKSTILLITLFGYGFAQYLFMNATTEISVILARFLAGIFSGGFQVSQLNYLVSQSKPEDRGYQLTLSSIFISAAGTVGFFIGGFVGDISILLTFQIQIALCMIVGLSYFIFLNKTESVQDSEPFEIKKLNPFKSLANVRVILVPVVVILMVSVFLSYVSITSFDQTFNYFVRDVYNFPPSYNGVLKMGTGLIGIIANFTISMYLIKKTNVKRSYTILMVVMALSGVTVVLVNQLWLLIVFAFIFLAIDAMSKPLQQTIVSGMSSDYHESHVLMGLYNTMKSLGLIVGALIAGFLYEWYKIGPFILASMAILIAALFMASVYKKTSSQAA
ncbi:MFS transporter [Jeotgalibaca dankookensis]|uniref:MFS transporter n=1 Tax=Jeotgalibaca dankookensis TaxID=708126 RepID=UPI0007825917|nr:MFS transporter [Jeotgalibaca dankookensis]